MAPVVCVRHCAAVAALLVLAGSGVHAGGPLVANGAGQPLKWGDSAVLYNPDRGGLGALGNSAAVARLANAAAAWNALDTSNVTLSASDPLPVDVNVSNYYSWLTDCADGMSPIIFDVDGKITDDLFGDGANEHILGFAAPACGTFVPPVFTEGYSVLNGRFLDGTDTPTNPETTPQEFDSVLVHELGHYLGIDHSQVTFTEATDADASNDDALATMFPVIVNATEQSSPHLDDIVAMSSLYPAASFATGFGTIAGTVYRSDGVTPFQGANVIARSVSDPRIVAVSQVSGARYFPSNLGGPPDDPVLQGRYELAGLPPGQYTVEIESVYAGFSGGSSVGPRDPAPLPGPPEFWNGSDEAAVSPPDDPAAAEAITIAAGDIVSSIDFVLNQAPPPANDDCSAAIEITTTPFTDTLDVTGATRGAFDALQTCGPTSNSQNYNSVWYRFTPPTDGVVSLSTAGTTFDSVASVVVGACGGVGEIACNDNGGPGLTSNLVFLAEAGVPYLFPITCPQAGGGILNLSFDFTPAADCAPSARNDCTDPAPRSSLRLRGGTDPANYALQWKWRPGTATTEDLGTPLVATGTSYALCVYESTGELAMSVRAPAGDRCGNGTETCWRSRSSGLSYKDRALLPDGLASMRLKAGTGDAKFKLKGAGSTLDVPPLPLAFPLSVQLVNSDGGCWQSTFPDTNVKTNDGMQVVAKNR